MGLLHSLEQLSNPLIPSPARRIEHSQSFHRIDRVEPICITHGDGVDLGMLAPVGGRLPMESSMDGPFEMALEHSGEVRRDVILAEIWVGAH